MKSSAVSLISAKKLKSADHGELAGYYRHCHSMGNEWLRKQIIENNRIDILAMAILGLQVQPFHFALMRHQFLNPHSLQLVFRGAGKSTTCTITKCVHLLLKNPNLRILIASKTSQNAEGFLKEVKGHFESNERLSEIFGPYFDARKVNKWDSREIEVLPRKSTAKEASVTCVGVDGTIVSKHYDIILSDDLVDDENSRTQYMRDKTRNWYYQTLDPTLEPPDAKVPHRGEHHHLGTRYHYNDLYGHLLSNELAENTQIIPALDSEGRSPWPEKYPPEWFAEKRKRSGLIIFNAQYQCDTEAMKGEIFQYDDCQLVQATAYPALDTLRIFMGVDLAISEKETADKFAIVVIGITTDRTGYYVLDYYEGQLRFNAQTSKIMEFYRRWDPIRVGLETVQYQEAQLQVLKELDPSIRIKPIKTTKDKVTRAWKLSPLFEEKRVFFKKTQHDLLVEHIVLFPNNEHDDLFDAMDLAVTASKIKRRRTRDHEPGVI